MRSSLSSGRRSACSGTLRSLTLNADEQKDIAAVLLPVIRGEMELHGWRPVLHFEGSEEALHIVGMERFAEVASRGVMTPEHILRAGVRPLVVALEGDRGAGDAVHERDPGIPGRVR